MQVTQAELLEAVRGVVAASDLNLLTVKKVRVEMVRVFAERIGDPAVFKQAVKSAINVVLGEGEGSSTWKDKSPNEKGRVGSADVEGGPHKAVKSKKDEPKGVSYEPKQSEEFQMRTGGSDWDSDFEAPKRKARTFVEKTETSSKLAQRKPLKVRTKRPQELQNRVNGERVVENRLHLKREGLGDMTVEPGENDIDEEGGPAARKRDHDDSDSDFEEPASSPVVTKKEVKPKKGSRKRPRESERGGAEESRAEKKVKKLMQVCIAIGCRAPPSILRSKDPHDRCEAIQAFLEGKGVTEANPTLLGRKELAAIRVRLEREKELDGLDVGNIIQEEGRPRRRRAAAPSKSFAQSNKFDFASLSGSEQSSASEGEESDGYENSSAEQ